MLTLYPVVSRTELARQSRKALESARRGLPVFIESYGEEEAVLLDVLDYRLLRAAAGYRSRPQAPILTPDLPPRGLTEAQAQQAVQAAGADVQAAWDVIVAAYLDGDISLGRAAQLLSMNRFELVSRFNRLGIALRLGPASAEDAQAELVALP